MPTAVMGVVIIYTIKAKSISNYVLRLLETVDKIKLHSKFKTGTNYECHDGLIFIGSNKNGDLPFGIHLKNIDILFMSKHHVAIFHVDAPNKKLYSPEMIVDWSAAREFESRLPHTGGQIKQETFRVLLELILCHDLQTGLDVSIKEVADLNHGVGKLLYDAVMMDDIEIQGHLLRDMIGRGKGLTPSGDDMFVGILWVHHLYPIFCESFQRNLEDLIFDGHLTTDVSENYFKAAFSGYYSSTLIALSHSLIGPLNKGVIFNCIRDIASCGHTSGADILAGIAWGLTFVNMNDGK